MSLLSFHVSTPIQQAQEGRGGSLLQPDSLRLPRIILSVGLSYLCTGMLLGLPNRISTCVSVNGGVDLSANNLQPGRGLARISVSAESLLVAVWVLLGGASLDLIYLVARLECSLPSLVVSGSALGSFLLPLYWRVQMDGAVGCST